MQLIKIPMLLVIVLALSACGESPSIENPLLTSYYRDQNKSDFIYSFEFDFINDMNVPIEIEKVQVLSDDIQVSNDLPKIRQMTGVPAEMMTHDVTYTNASPAMVQQVNKTFQAIPFMKGTPLEKASITMSSGGFFSRAKFSVQPEKRTMFPDEAVTQARYLLANKQPFDELTLVIQYSADNESYFLEQTFSVAQQRYLKLN